MHVPDGFINAPVSAASGLISLGTIWAYIRNAKNLVADRLIALTGMMSALIFVLQMICLLYTSPSPRDATLSRMPSSA